MHEYKTQGPIYRKEIANLRFLDLTLNYQIDFITIDMQTETWDNVFYFNISL